VTTFELTGRPQNQLEDEVTVNAEGGFVATSIGYGLLVEERAIAFRMGGVGAISITEELAPHEPRTGTIQNIQTNLTKDFTTRSDAEFLIFPLDAGDYKIVYKGALNSLEFTMHVEAGKTSRLKADLSTGSIETLDPAFVPLETIDLAQLPLRMLPADALLDGLRINPHLIRLAFENDGAPSHHLSLAVANQLFERLNQPEDVSFRYTIFDSGRGRELQNQPLHNVAGLGIANGDRPFKKLARSMIFQPRSTLRIRVEERFGRGTLFIVLQGYKFLSTPVAGGQR
jgi:hypothetical protein